MKLNENEIIERCQHGDWSSFDFLYDSYISKIYSFVYFKTMHKETAEDLTSQTFLKAVEKISTFDKNTNFSAWLYTIARNLVIDYYRKKKSDFDIEDFWDLSSGDDLFQEVCIKHDFNKVRDYLSTLDKTQRELILMRVWSGMKFKEISEILGKSEAGTKMEFYRLVDKIKKEVLVSIIILAVISNINSIN